ncbi:MAG: DUF86 domain-containing protein [Flavobacteriales bacterium]|nr:DUF86 domain-containing protein [Flavobacteriales bacterium]
MERLEGFYADILRAIELIEDFLAQGHIDSFEAYTKHAMVRSAVERQLGIIGEAVNQIRKLDPAHPIPEADRIVQFRNRLIHSYDTIDDTFVWPIIQKHLHVLKATIRRALGQ